ncbi:endonuclease domain-containing 1 protein-like [Hoplias malabaricus]|uniref:endonuclease domain-containing 1 protein-like n=1 Tax=Hoplias malabaricus TaxID=27720 RepID=UPI0034622022
MKYYPLIFLLTLISLSSSRLVGDFLSSPEGCPQFFLKTRDGHFTPSILPDGQRFQQICQRYLGVDRFATFYDTHNKIPVYSAYRHIPHQRTIRASPNNWWTEPDLNIDEQANNWDYFQSRMKKGHLYPVYYSNDVKGIEDSFTLTNAVPQDQRFSTQWFTQVEKPVTELLQYNCAWNQVYVVTGVVPSKHKINKRVAIPSHFWTAYCCLDTKGNVVAHGAYLAQWIGFMNLTKYPNMVGLEKELTGLYPVGIFQFFQVFGGRC